MLANLIVVKEQETVYRLASAKQDEKVIELLIELGANPENIEEIRVLLNRLRTPLTVDEIIDDAFQPNQDELNPFPVT